MATRTAIEWTDITTAVGVYGCKSASPACRYCYAAAMAWRLQHMPHTAERYAGTAKRDGGRALFTGVVRCDADLLDKAMAELPKGLKRCEDGTRRQWRCFPANMTDLFHPSVPFEHIAKVFAHFEARPHIVFQCLTKRTERMAEFWQWYRRWWETQTFDPNKRWPVNVWAGATVEDQERTDRIEWLRQVPAAVRFLSCEPLLGALDVDLAGIHWCITGGESGPHARPSDVAWFRSLRGQCAGAGTAFFMKQITEGGRKIPYDQWPADLQVREFPDA